MPLTALWSLIVALVMLAIGLSLKLANISHSLKLSDKELDSLIKQIALLKEKHEETVSRFSEFHEAETKKIIKEYTAQIDILIDKVVELKTPHQNTLSNLYLQQSFEASDKPMSLADLGRAINPQIRR